MGMICQAIDGITGPDRLSANFLQVDEVSILFSFYYRCIGMADAKLVSSPSITADGGVASTVHPSTTEGRIISVSAAGGESEESGETPEAGALAQGPYDYPISLLHRLI